MEARRATNVRRRLVMLFATAHELIGAVGVFIGSSAPFSGHTTTTLGP